VRERSLPPEVIPLISSSMAQKLPVASRSRGD